MVSLVSWEMQQYFFSSEIVTKETKLTRTSVEFLLAWSFIASKDAMPLALVMDPTAATATATAAASAAPGTLLINHNQHQKERGILKRGVLLREER